MEKQIPDTGLGDDPRIPQLATALLDVMHTEGVLPSKYNVRLDGAKGVPVGDHNTQADTFD